VLDVTVPTPLSILAVPFAKVAVKLTLLPMVMVFDEVTKLVIDGILNPVAAGEVKNPVSTNVPVPVIFRSASERS
jgi:hypothetical protein